MSFANEQPKKKSIKPRLPLVFIDSVHFLNNSLDNFVKNSGENDFYLLSKDLVKKKGFFANGIALKISEKA